MSWSLRHQAHRKQLGLVADEDYIAWGAVERAPGEWQWKQYDAMEQTLHKAGLKYVVYDWLHFPPVWLRDQQTNPIARARYSPINGWGRHINFIMSRNALNPRAT